MAFAANQTRTSAQSNARSGPVVRFIWHHQAGTNDDGTIDAMVSGSRQVSATWTVSNTGRVTSVVPESRRPWTSASSADDGALTVECANSSGPPGYGISDASHEACARLAAYAHEAYGIPLQRATAANGWRGHMGHKELYGTEWGGYATACPMNLDIDRILDLASGGSAIGGGALQPTPQEDELSAEAEKQIRELYELLIPLERGVPDVNGPNLVSTLYKNFTQMNQRADKTFSEWWPALFNSVGVLMARSGTTGTGLSKAELVDAISDALDDELAEAVVAKLAEKLAAK